MALYVSKQYLGIIWAFSCRAGIFIDNRLEFIINEDTRTTIIYIQSIVQMWLLASLCLWSNKKYLKTKFIQ